MTALLITGKGMGMASSLGSRVETAAAGFRAGISRAAALPWLTVGGIDGEDVVVTGSPSWRENRSSTSPTTAARSVATLVSGGSRLVGHPRTPPNHAAPTREVSGSKAPLLSVVPPAQHLLSRGDCMVAHMNC